MKTEQHYRIADKNEIRDLKDIEELYNILYVESQGIYLVGIDVIPSPEKVSDLSDEEIRNKALEIVGYDRLSGELYTQEMAVNFITIYAKWLRSRQSIPTMEMPTKELLRDAFEAGQEYNKMIHGLCFDGMNFDDWFESRTKKKGREVK
jgi:hypothetical protein